jgi:hypothetical protein
MPEAASTDDRWQRLVARSRAATARPREWSQLDGEPCSRSPRATVHSAASCAVAHS